MPECPDHKKPMSSVIMGWICTELVAFYSTNGKKLVKCGNTVGIEGCSKHAR